MDQTDTIPRIAQFPAHMTSQLVCLVPGATFEQVRSKAIATARALSEEGLGREVASRVGDRDKMWSTAAEILAEGMKLGFVVSDRLPSSRRYLDQYRDRVYHLTEVGQEVAKLAGDPALLVALYDRLVTGLIKQHLHFRALLRSLQNAPLVCPEVTEEDVKPTKTRVRGITFWADHVVRAIGANPADATAAGQTIRDFLNRRFQGSDPAAITNKAKATALNEAMAAASLQYRGLPFGSTDLRIMAGWGMGLLILDQSRYVGKHTGANVIWLASDVNTDPSVQVLRHGLSKFATPVAAKIIDSYRQLACLERHVALQVPYIPIHCVRAPVAFELGVMRVLVDRVLEMILAGQFPELGVSVELYLGNSIPPPNSEPIYKRGGARKYVMTIRSAKSTTPMPAEEHDDDDRT